MQEKLMLMPPNWKTTIFKGTSKLGEWVGRTSLAHSSETINTNICIFFKTLFIFAVLVALENNSL